MERKGTKQHYKGNKISIAQRKLLEMENKSLKNLDRMMQNHNHNQREESINCKCDETHSIYRLLQRFSTFV